jgi:hypothetical protein
MATDTPPIAGKPAEKKHKAPAEHSTLHISKALIDGVAARFGLKGGDVRQRFEASLPTHLKALEEALHAEKIAKLEAEQSARAKELAALKGTAAVPGDGGPGFGLKS